MDEDSIPLTAFTVGPLGFYECVRMPFGLTNAPATFQRLMESCLGDLHLKYCIIYLDDIIIFLKTPGEHLKQLRSVFEKLDEAGLRLKPGKCEFFRPQLEYLGHVVSKEGIETNPKKMAAIVNWPRPTTVTQAEIFGVLQLLPEIYAQVAKPLYQLVSRNNAKAKRKEFKSGQEVVKRMRGSLLEIEENLQQHTCLGICRLPVAV